MIRCCGKARRSLFERRQESEQRVSDEEQCHSDMVKRPPDFASNAWRETRPRQRAQKRRSRNGRRDAGRHSDARIGRKNDMPTRQERLAEFTSSGEPPAQTCEILCEDHNGTLYASFPGPLFRWALAQLRYWGACGGFGRWLAPAAADIGQVTHSRLSGVREWRRNPRLSKMARRAQVRSAVARDRPMGSDVCFEADWKSSVSVRYIQMWSMKSPSSSLGYHFRQVVFDVLHG